MRNMSGRKWISLALALLLVFGAVPAAYGQEIDSTDENRQGGNLSNEQRAGGIAAPLSIPVLALAGDGTEEKPYELSGSSDLDTLKIALRSSALEGVYFKVVNDIHAVAPWEGLGSENYPFCGYLDGGGKTIYLSHETNVPHGLFNYVGSESAETTHIVNLNVELPTVSSIKGSKVGVLVNEAVNAEFDNCSVTLSGPISGSESVGGMIGSGREISLRNCHVAARASGIVRGTGYGYAGGVVGSILIDEVEDEFWSSSSADTIKLGSVIEMNDVSYEGDVEFASEGAGGIIGSIFYMSSYTSDASGYLSGYANGLLELNVNAEINASFRFSDLRMEGDIIHTGTSPAHSVGGNIGEITILPNVYVNFSETAYNPLIDRVDLTVHPDVKMNVTADNLSFNGNIDLGSSGTVIQNNLGGNIGSISLSMDLSFGLDELLESNAVQTNVEVNAGLIEIEAALTDCTAEGAMISESSGRRGYVGGVLGNHDAFVSWEFMDIEEVENSDIVIKGNQKSSLTLENCSFDGGITLCSTFVDSVGGLVGYANFGDQKDGNERDEVRDHVDWSVSIKESRVGKDGDPSSINISWADPNNPIYMQSGQAAGGLIGFSSGSLLIDDSHANVDITVDVEKTFAEIGGLAGYISGWSNTEILLKDSSFSGELQVLSDDEITAIGGLAGLLISYPGGEAVIDHCSVIAAADGSAFNVEGKTVTGVGTVAGLAAGDVTVKNSHFNVPWTVKSEEEIQGFGGLIGQHSREEGNRMANYYPDQTGDIFIENSSYTGQLSAVAELVEGMGGLVGGQGFPGVDAGALTVEESFFSGDLNLDAAQAASVGGLAGFQLGTTSVRESYSHGSISLQSDGSGGDPVLLGGGLLAGGLKELNLIADSYTTGTISAKGGTASGVGLFIGLIDDGATGTVSRNYSAGSLDLEAGDWVGAFTGSMGNSLDLQHNYFDEKGMDGHEGVGIAEQPAVGLKSLSTWEMTRENPDKRDPDARLDTSLGSMEGFDFDQVWLIAANETDTGFYPQLRRMAESSQRGFSKDSVKTDAYYLLQIDGNGGGAASGETGVLNWQLYDTEVTAPDFVKNGKAVVKWLDKGGAEVTIPDKLLADFYAIADYDESTGGGGGNRYSVIYHGNNGRAEKDVTDSGYRSGATVTVKSGSLFTAPADQEFTGWSTSEKGNPVYQPGDTFTMPAKAVHLYAIWQDEKGVRLNLDDHYAYVVGYPDGTVRPEAQITREEVATIFFRLLTDESRDQIFSKANRFTDVSTDRWSNTAVSTLSRGGIISGYEDGSFQPAGMITRAEVAVIAAQFDDSSAHTGEDLFSDVGGHWAREYINRAAGIGWISGYENGTFRPDAYITRAEMMSLVNQVLNRVVESPADLHKDMTSWPDNLDTSKWYYTAVQEATNSHYYERKDGGKAERWTGIRNTRDWAELERP